MIFVFVESFGDGVWIKKDGQFLLLEGVEVKVLAQKLSRLVSPEPESEPPVQEEVEVKHEEDVKQEDDVVEVVEPVVPKAVGVRKPVSDFAKRLVHKRLK